MLRSHPHPHIYLPARVCLCCFSFLFFSFAVIDLSRLPPWWIQGIRWVTLRWQVSFLIKSLNTCLTCLKPLLLLFFFHSGMQNSRMIKKRPVSAWIITLLKCSKLAEVFFFVVLQTFPKDQTFFYLIKKRCLGIRIFYSRRCGIKHQKFEGKSSLVDAMLLNLTVYFDLAHLKSLWQKKGAKYIKSPTSYGLSTQTLVEQQRIISKRMKKKHCVSTENSPLFTASC